jgi:hypothetical protein
MMSAIGRLLACSALLVTYLGAADRYALHEESTISKTLQFAGSGMPTLDVRTNSGSVQISAYGGREVQVEAKKTMWAEDDAAMRDARQDVTLDTHDGEATVTAVVRENGREACGESGSSRSRAWWDRRRYEVTVDLTIKVPAGTRLSLCTVNSSDVTVQGTSGDFDVRNVNGRISLENIRGSGRATTVNGRVEAAFAEAPRSDSLFKTVNGDIRVTLPRDASASLRLKTLHGGLFTDFDVVPQPLQATPSQDSRNGKYVYRSNGFTAVRVGKGGPELTFDTLNGDVRVLRAPR